MKLTHILATGLIGALVACSGSDTTTADRAGDRLEVVSGDVAVDRLAAVLIYADWCSSCKILDPKLQAAKAEGEIDGVSYHTLDYTARDEDALFAGADALGVGRAIREQLSGNVKTGILLLVDVDDRRIVGDLRKELSSEELRAAIEAAASDA